MAEKPLGGGGKNKKRGWDGANKKYIYIKNKTKMLSVPETMAAENKSIGATIRISREI